MKTCHSEYGTIKSLWIKPVTAAFLNQQILSSQWKELNYLGEPIYQKSLTEYKEFQSNFTRENIELNFFSADDHVMMDSIYCRDAAIATDYGMIICNMGKGGRINEPEAQAKAYRSAGFEIFGSIKAPGTLEGGDVAWLDDKTLAVGHTYRTNEEGISQLKALLNPKGIEVISVALPHYKGSSDVFHLMSILSPVDKDLAVVYSPLMPITFRDTLLDRGFRFVEVPEEEFDSMGCNILALSARKCLMVAGNPITAARLEAEGCEVITYPGDEISVKGGGGPTCLTRPVYREI
ncbi:dimethylarginine dimethylaminohydrolase family protein [Roseivirga sp.]|uniref:dimethylarginine dimethylaminohydrolase family protein n=1 Tax=Roseivirga sp. TaxID=1964215 RepID=UPI003B8B4BAA